jgi:DNA-binding Xre family transcriptional regulator|nr:MAG TPA_asm: Cro/C1-type HTH DNA-binding domain protein [Caudoviricetes sp.]
MTLEDAMKARGIRVNELCRKSTVSRPTLDSILGRRRARHKEGIRTGTLLKICDVLNAYAIVDSSNPDYFDVVLKKVKK